MKKRTFWFIVCALVMALTAVSLLLAAQEKESVYDPHMEIYSNDGNVEISRVDQRFEKCRLVFNGISLRKAQDLLVDYAIKARQDSGIGGYKVYYDPITKVYSAWNEHLLEPILMIESNRVNDIRKYFKTDEMLFGMLGCL